MRCPPRPTRCLAAATLVALCLAVPCVAQVASRPAVMWIDPSGVNGAPGDVRPEGAGPGTTFRFVHESSSGTSPKFEVEDERGTRWKVKLGEEARAETAAASLLRAVGYQVDEDFYLDTMTVVGLTRLARGRQYVGPGGIVLGARLERVVAPAPSRTWSWFANPFTGTREFNGLRVMMALINNWDLKSVNNETGDLPGGDGRYRVADLGATFGRTGNSLVRSKSNEVDYASAPFIARVSETTVDFVLHSRPYLLSLFSLRNYRARTQMERTVRRIPIEDARWIGVRLSQLAPAAIEQVFRDAGYAPDEVDIYSRGVLTRIAQLRYLAPAPLSGVTTEPPATHAPDTISSLMRCQADRCQQVPAREHVTPVRLATTYARAIIGGFEQGAGLGGGVQVTTAGMLPFLEVRAAALTSTQLFRRLEVEALVPFVWSSRQHVSFRAIDLHRDVDFASLGAETAADVQTHFALAQRSYQGTFTRDLAPHLQGGAYAQMASTLTSPGRATSDPRIGTGFSNLACGTTERCLPGFLARTRILSYGAYLAFDNRDDSVGLTRGVNVYARAADARGLDAHAEEPTYGWLDTEVDARVYIPLGSPRTSLLARSRLQFKTPKAGDQQIPFYDLSSLGGRTSLRGYHSYRFRANNAALLSSEVQRTIRTFSPARGLDLLVSADAGQVWGDNRLTIDQSTTPSRFSRHNWHAGVGAGVQFRYSRHFAARLEISRSHERTFTYAAVARGF